MRFLTPAELKPLGASRARYEVIKKTHLTHYWEAGHFKKELGDLAIERLLGKNNSFGIKLDSGNIERWLAEDRHRVQALLNAPSPIAREVEDLVARHEQNQAKPRELFFK